MRGLLKFILLSFAFCLNLFSFEFRDPGQYSLFMNLNYFPGMRQIDAELISDEYFSYRNDIFKIIIASDYFVLAPANFNDFAFYGSDFYYFNPTPKTAYCEGANTDQTTYSRNCSVEKIGVRQKIEYQNVKKITATKVATCEPGENFNTSTQKCQSCPSGQSWNPKTNSCYKDCSDLNNNIFGFTDGSCINCSQQKTSYDVVKCFCDGLGLTFNNISPYFEGNGVMHSYCEDSSGSTKIEFEFRDPEKKKPDPKPDDNKTKPDDPKPDNPDNPDPDNKDKDNKDNKDNQNKDNKDNKDKKDKQQDQKKQDKNEQQKPKDRMSKDNAEQLLNAAIQNEKATQQRISKAMQQRGSRRLQKNW